MSNSYTRSGKRPGVQRSDLRTIEDSEPRGDSQFGTFWDQFFVRSIFAVACVSAGYHFHPFGLSAPAAAVVDCYFPWLYFYSKSGCAAPACAG